MTRVAVVFPGQGAQRPGLGEPWRDHPAWEVVERADELLGEPVSRLLLDASPEELSHTREAQLAVLVASLVAWEAARHHLTEPAVFAGHSLGQVTALIASGALGLAEGLAVAEARASATQRAAARNPGRMVALLGASLETAGASCEASPGACWVANDNAEGQVVIGGTPGGVEAAVARARQLGVRKAVPLDVDGAFHTPLMQEAADALFPHAASARFAAPVAPVVANTDARPHADTAWAPRLVEHLVRPVRWRESMEVLSSLGASTVVEVGPGGVLAGLARRAMPGARVEVVATPADVAAVAAAGAPA